MSTIGHIKIALTTKSLTRVDCSFVQCLQIVTYDVSAGSSEFIDVTRFAGGGGGQGKGRANNGGVCWMDEAETSGTDRVTPRVEAAVGCKVIFTKGLSDLAAVKLRDIGVFPVKMERDREVDEVIETLQQMMRQRQPPLWLRRAMGVTISEVPPERDDDEDEAA